ncbi:thiol:disulfide interchange protein DsbA/DsbL [Gilvimarinus japonicus]|jgi:thiol:disulfide interchange protein DsbA|uniref:Thiol:disulfide interchange protein n=1 Tax=Gilvimarinus japonicus TaxID=1796469 RepID=A0ABV7HNC9_9GAMM
MRVLVAFLGLMFSLVACAEDSATAAAPGYEEGKEYTELAEAVRTDDADKIEVREMFAYTCGHCFRFDPLFHEWREKQADDVNVVQTPVVWAKQMEPYARAFYTAKALGVLEDSHMDLFNALHIQKARILNVEDFAEFYSQYGVDKDKFTKTFESFGIDSQLRQGDAKARAYGISGTPELVVDGRYRVSASGAGGHREMLQVADYLVEKIRAEKK